MIHSGKFSLVVAARSHNLPIYNKWLGPALGSKVKSHYTIEHNVSIIQLPLAKHNTGSSTRNSPRPKPNRSFAPKPPGREPSAATGLSPEEDRGGKCTHQGAQE